MSNKDRSAVEAKLVKESPNMLLPPPTKKQYAPIPLTLSKWNPSTTKPYPEGYDHDRTLDLFRKINETEAKGEIWDDGQALGDNGLNWIPLLCDVPAGFVVVELRSPRKYGIHQYGLLRKEEAKRHGYPMLKSYEWCLGPDSTQASVKSSPFGHTTDLWKCHYRKYFPPSPVIEKAHSINCITYYELAQLMQAKVDGLRTQIHENRLVQIQADAQVARDLKQAQVQLGFAKLFSFIQFVAVVAITFKVLSWLFSTHNNTRAKA